MTKIFVGADHRGFTLKEDLKKSFPEMQDMGRGYGEFAGDDFNEPARVVAEKVLAEPESRGVLICGTGVGMSIQAYRFPGVRAVLARSVSDAQKARKHNNVNVLCLGADETDFAEAVKIIEAFLETDFLDEEKYRRRNDKLDMGCFCKGKCECCGDKKSGSNIVDKEEG